MKKKHNPTFQRVQNKKKVGLLLLDCFKIIESYLIASFMPLCT